MCEQIRGLCVCENQLHHWVSKELQAVSPSLCPWESASSVKTESIEASAAY